jgi:hypothetical protein
MEQSLNDAAAPRKDASVRPLPAALANAPLVSHARFRIGDRVQHGTFGFRGIIFDVDPVFSNSEEWYEANPLQPDRNQPFYHLLADNGEQMVKGMSRSIIRRSRRCSSACRTAPMR